MSDPNPPSRSQRKTMPTRQLAIALLFVLSSLTAITVAQAQPPSTDPSDITECLTSSPPDNCAAFLGCLAEGTPADCSDEFPLCDPNQGTPSTDDDCVQDPGDCPAPLSADQCADIDGIAAACDPGAIAGDEGAACQIAILGIVCSDLNNPAGVCTIADSTVGFAEETVAAITDIVEACEGLPETDECFEATGLDVVVDGAAGVICPAAARDGSGTLASLCEELGGTPAPFPTCTGADGEIPSVTCEGNVMTLVPTCEAGDEFDPADQTTYACVLDDPESVPDFVVEQLEGVLCSEDSPVAEFLAMCGGVLPKIGIPDCADPDPNEEAFCSTLQTVLGAVGETGVVLIDPFGDDSISPIDESDEAANPTIVRVTLPGCTLDVKKAGAGGTDFTRYDRYSDLDDDGVRDGQDDDPLSSCQAGVPSEGDADGDGVPDEDEMENGTDPLTPDTDGDLLTDCQETGYSGVKPNGGLNNSESCNGLGSYHTSPTDSDSDGDGSLDGIEVQLGSNPTDPTEVPRDTLVDRVLDLLEVIPDLPVPNDLDGDKLTDEQEEDLGTDPGNPDTDADGLNDCQETGFVERGTAPNTPEANLTAGKPWVTGANETGDRDCGDGITLYHTDTLEADSDGDLVVDGDEAFGQYAFDDCELFAPYSGRGDLAELNTIPVLGDMIMDLLLPTGMEAVCTGIVTNPTVDDTDDDLLDDNQEVGNGAFDTVEGYRTNPVKPDTDGDRLLDGVELIQREASDPMEPDTDDDGLDDCIEGGYIAYGTGLNVAPSDLTGDVSGHSGVDAVLSAERDCKAGHLTYFTSPLVADSDGDVISDYDEINGRDLTNPPWPLIGGSLSPVPGEPVDSFWDSFVVIQADVKTNPSALDTDGDSWSDCAEVGFKPNSGIEGTILADGVEAEAFASRYGDLEVGLVERLAILCPSTAQFWWTSPSEIDSDDDGVSDKLEIPGTATRSNYGNPTIADTDGDGLKDCQETVPRPRNTPLPDELLTHGLTGAALVTVVGPACRELDNAAPVVGPTYATAPRTWDSDDDGPKDGQELIDGTNPLNRHHLKGSGDADSDLVLDCQEVGRGFGFGTGGGDSGITTNTVPAADDFNDTVTQRVCTDGTSAGLPRYVTAPNDKDSDNDELLDGKEILEGIAYGPATVHSNPTKLDTDGDGGEDCSEAGFVAEAPQVSAGNDGVGRCNRDRNGSSSGTAAPAEWATNPRVKDSDNDDLQDGYEALTHGTNPAKIDTDGDFLSDCQERSRVTTVTTVNGQGIPQVVQPAMDPIAAGVTCSVHPGMAGAGKAYLTDPRFADSDRDALLGTPAELPNKDGQEVAAETNPTIAFLPNADNACSDAGVGDDCTGAPANVTAMAAGPVLNTLRFPDPTRLRDEQSDCNFLDPGSWGFYIQPRTDPAEAADNGLIDWYDEANDEWLLWDGSDSACNDFGDPDDDSEKAGEDNGDSVYDQHLGNYVLGVVREQDPDSLLEDAQAILDAIQDSIGNGSYAGELVDKRDPFDVDADGIVAEANGQIDAVEDLVLVIDTHGDLQADLPTPNGNETGAADSQKNDDFPEDATGITVYVREPRTMQVRATVSIYLDGPAIAIVEVLQGGSFQTACITESGPTGPAAGRFDGVCPEGGVDSDGDRFPDAMEQGFDAVFGGHTDQDVNQTPLSTIQGIGTEIADAILDDIEENCAQQPETFGGLTNPMYEACELMRTGGDPDAIVATLVATLECIQDVECEDSPVCTIDDACAIPDLVLETLCGLHGDLAATLGPELCPPPPPAFKADAGEDKTGNIGEAIAISATASGPGSEAAETCVWTGAGATFADDEACSTTVTFATAGDKTITVEMTGVGGVKDTDDAKVTVSDPNAPPACLPQSGTDVFPACVIEQVLGVPDMVLDQICEMQDLPQCAAECDPTADPTCDPEAFVEGLLAAVCAEAPCPTSFEPCGDVDPDPTDVRICQHQTAGSLTGRTNEHTGGQGGIVVEIRSIRVHV